MDELVDIEQQCRDCGKNFIISAAQQLKFKNLVGEDGKPFVLPKRCPDCRLKRKGLSGGYNDRR